MRVRAWLGVAMGLAALLPAAAARADDIYAYRQTDGIRVFSDRKPPRGPYAIIAKYGRPPAWSSCTGLTAKSLEDRAASYYPVINKYAKANDVPAGLISAVMRVESCYDRKAVSKVGARGLMQLMPDTAKELGVHDSFDAEQNIAGGVRYLATLIKRFNKNIKLAVAAYNAGPEAVDQHHGVPPFPETTSYVKRVLAHYAGGQTG